MSGAVQWADAAAASGVARLTLSSPGTLNAIDSRVCLYDAPEALRAGAVHALVADDEVASTTLQRAERIAALSPQAARINKRTLRQIAAGGPTPAERRAHFGYADSAEHREGIAAFIAKRPARFERS